MCPTFWHFSHQEDESNRLSFQCLFFSFFCSQILWFFRWEIHLKKQQREKQQQRCFFSLKNMSQRKTLPRSRQSFLETKQKKIKGSWLKLLFPFSCFPLFFKKHLQKRFNLSSKKVQLDVVKLFWTLCIECGKPCLFLSLFHMAKKTFCLSEQNGNSPEDAWLKKEKVSSSWMKKTNLTKHACQTRKQKKRSLP